jgi:Trk K+ transport system NAD-binding subunit
LVDRGLPEALAGRRLSDLEVAGKISLLAVTRAGEPRLDARELVGQDGDIMHFAVLKSAWNDLDEILGTSDSDAPLTGSHAEPRS